MGRFAARNGPYRMMKRPISQRDMGRFASGCGGGGNILWRVYRFTWNIVVCRHLNSFWAIMLRYMRQLRQMCPPVFL